MEATAGTLPMTSTFRDFVALTKPRITFLVLVTAAGGAWLAPGKMSAFRFIATLLTTCTVVAGANVLNCWMERDSDRFMTRTAKRPLADRRIDARAALIFGIILSAISLPAMFVLLNPLTGLLGALALFMYVGIYTPMKRRSWTALLIGAVPGALPPLMGWTAATNHLDTPGLVLFAIMFLWQVPHFIAIAIFRKEEYARAGIKVLPLVAGDRLAVLHGVIYAAVLLPVSLLLVPMRVAGMGYFVVALLTGIAFLIYTMLGLRKDAGHKWAKQLFIISLLYITLIFAALMLDAA